ncbi:unnamed protein product [Alopecurus aequalis]
MPPPAPPLPDDLVEEIFLRLPPDEPASLVRASLASKPWLAILTGAGFGGRYREFHGAPPMLGFLYSWLGGSTREPDPVPPFIPTTKFGAHIHDVEDLGVLWNIHLDYDVVDCRHGRVLLCEIHDGPVVLVVWDPMTGRWSRLISPVDYSNKRAAVLCAVTGCDHRACHEGSFRVVFVATGNEDGDGHCVAYESVSMLETAEPTKPCFDRHMLQEEWSSSCYGCLDDLPDDACLEPMPPVLVDEALHFMLTYTDDDSVAILKYSLDSKCLSLIDAPLWEDDMARATILMHMNDGSLGFAMVDGLTLNLWSRQICSSGVEAWTQPIVINLKKFLPIQNPTQTLRVIGSVEGTHIIFVTTDLGIYEINLESLQQKKIWKRGIYHALFPYMSFYNPPERVRADDVAH